MDGENGLNFYVFIKRNRKKAAVFTQSDVSFVLPLFIEGESNATSLERIISNPPKGIKINKDLISSEKERQGEEKLKRILSRLKEYYLAYKYESKK